MCTLKEYDERLLSDNAFAESVAEALAKLIQEMKAGKIILTSLPKPKECLMLCLLISFLQRGKVDSRSLWEVIF